jgi:hypothetical protein
MTSPQRLATLESIFLKAQDLFNSFGKETDRKIDRQVGQK